MTLRLIQGSKQAEPLLCDGLHDELSELARAAVSGDRVALKTLLVKLVPELLRAVRRVLGADHARVEDVVQAAAYATIERLPHFRNEGTVLQFSCRIAVLTAINVRRRDAEQRVCKGAAASPRTAEEQPAVTGALAPIVRDLLDTLPDPLAETLALHVILRYSAADISDMCHLPLDIVRARLRIGQEALRKRVLGQLNLQETAEGRP